MRRYDPWREFYEMDREAESRKPRAEEPKVQLHLEGDQLTDLAVHQMHVYGTEACLAFVRSKLAFEAADFALLGSSRNSRQEARRELDHAQRRMFGCALAIGVELKRVPGNAIGARRVR
jgi:hypothetical protein